MIGIIDYGLGNVLAFQNVYKRCGIPAGVVRTPEDVDRSERLIMPGVGSFDHAMRLFDRSGLRPAVERAVREKRVPILGVCVGMQMLANGSDEGSLPGLGWIPGMVRRLSAPASAEKTRLPHMGWNEVTAVGETPLFQDLGSSAQFYFLHSYYFEAEQDRAVIAVASYGRTFTCAVRDTNVYGVQFHPEKSHRWGQQLLKNFATL